MARSPKNTPAAQANQPQADRPAAEIDPVNSGEPTGGADDVAGSPADLDDVPAMDDGDPAASDEPTIAEDDDGRQVPGIPDNLIVPLQVSSQPGSADYYRDLHAHNAACDQRAVSNKDEAKLLEIQQLVVASILGGTNPDYLLVQQDLKARGIALRSDNNTWLARSWFTWRDLKQPKDNSTATNRGKSAAKLWQVILHRQENRPQPYAAHNEADVRELMGVVKDLGGFKGVRDWAPPADDKSPPEDDTDIKRIKLDEAALRDERVRLGLLVVANEEQTIKIGNRHVRTLDPSNEAHRGLLSDLAAGPAAVEVLGTALRLAAGCVNLDDKVAKRHLLIRRDGTLLLTVQHQAASVMVEIVPKRDILPLLYPMGLPLAAELWAEAQSREKAYNNIGEAARRPAFTLTPDFVNRGGKRTIFEWVLATEFGIKGPGEKFTVHLRDAYLWSLPSEHQKAGGDQKDKTPRDLLPGFTPNFTASIAPEAIAAHVKAADNIARLSKKGLTDVVLRPVKNAIEVRERHFDPPLPLLPGSSGTMVDVRVLPADWAGVIQALDELRTTEPVRFEVDAGRDMLKFTAQVPVAVCRLWVPLLGPKGRATTLIGKMQLGAAS